jgi:hypothetical protein
MKQELVDKYYPHKDPSAVTNAQAEQAGVR